MKKKYDNLGLFGKLLRLQVLRAQVVPADWAGQEALPDAVRGGQGRRVQEVKFHNEF